MFLMFSSCSIFGDFFLTVCPLLYLLSVISLGKQLHVNSNGLDADAGKLFLPIVDKPHFEVFSGIPIKQIRENTVTKLDLKGSDGKQLEACGGVVLAHVLTGNTSVQQLDASSNAMGSAGAKAFGDTLLVNKTLQTLDVSDNSFGKVQVGEQVKLKSSGETCTVLGVKDSGKFDIKFANGKECDDYMEPSEFEWESQVSALCAGVAASPSLLSVSTIFCDPLAVIFLTPPLFPTMYVARCFREQAGSRGRKGRRGGPEDQPGTVHHCSQRQGQEHHHPCRSASPEHSGHPGLQRARPSRGWRDVHRGRAAEE